MFIALAFVCSLHAHALPSHAAGIPVVDGASIAQNAANFLQEMLEMAKQLEMLQSQLSQQIKEYESLTGDRGMGALLDGQVKNYIPDNWKSALAILDKPSGYSKLSSAVQDILESNKILSDSEVSRFGPNTRRVLEDQRKAVATYQALSGASLDNASERFGALQELTNKIGSATDPKAILDLQARIQSEQTSLTNEANKLQALSETLRAQEALREQRRREINSRSGGYVK